MPRNAITVRLTEQEKKEVEAKAKQYNMTISEYIRLVSINAEIDVKVEQEPVRGMTKKDFKYIQDQLRGRKGK